MPAAVEFKSLNVDAAVMLMIVVGGERGWTFPNGDAEWLKEGDKQR